MSDLPDTHDRQTDTAGDASMDDLFGDGDASEPERDQPKTTEPMSDTQPTTDETTGNGAMSGPNEYDPMEVYDRNVHRINGDETIVILSSFARGYQAFALDVDKAGEILETEIIGDAEDRQRAESMCEYWVQQNPKGILGSGEDDGGGGFLASLGFGGGGE